MPTLWPATTNGWFHSDFQDTYSLFHPQIITNLWIYIFVMYSHLSFVHVNAFELLVLGQTNYTVSDYEPLSWSELNQQRDLWFAPVLLSSWRTQQCLYAVSTVLQTSQTIKWCNLTSHWSRPVPAWMTQPSSASHYQAPITLNRITDQSFIMYSAALPHFDQLCQDSAAAHRKSNPRALVFVLAPPVDKKQGNNIKP